MRPEQCSVAEEIPEASKHGAFSLGRAAGSGGVPQDAVGEPRKRQALQHDDPVAAQRRQEQTFAAKERLYHFTASRETTEPMRSSSDSYL